MYDGGNQINLVTDRRRSSGWKVGARNALLQWCKEIITPKFGIHVENFGSSWRDGRAFVALISALNPGLQCCWIIVNIYVHHCFRSDLFVKLEDFEGLLTLHALQGKSNQSRLKIAFLIAEKEFGIYPLLDPEDVDVSNPDEKSVMTYVAQFLNKFSSKVRRPSFFSLDQHVMFSFRAPALRPIKKLQPLVRMSTNKQSRKRQIAARVFCSLLLNMCINLCPNDLPAPK